MTDENDKKNKKEKNKKKKEKGDKKSKSDKKKKKKKKKNKNKRIRGDLSCFKGSELEKMARTLFCGPLIEDDLISLRNTGKAAFGARMKMAACFSNVYTPISDVSLNIVLAHLKTLSYAPNACSFADCLIYSYNGNTNYELKPPKCETNVPYKALKHGVKDCLAAFEAYFKPIQTRMVNSKAHIILDNNIVGKYNDIKVALSFTINYINDLCCGKMPNKISVNVFNKAVNHDKKIADLYEFNDSDSVYRIDSNKNCKYSSVTQECATYLICNKHK